MTRIALIAHDDEKPEMIDLVETYEGLLSGFDLVATGTTGERVAEETGLDVHDTPLSTSRTAAEYLLDGLAADREDD